MPGCETRAETGESGGGRRRNKSISAAAGNLKYAVSRGWPPSGARGSASRAPRRAQRGRA